MSAIEVDQFLPHPPAKVWRALTEPELFERWVNMPNDIRPVVGHRFELLTQPVPAANHPGGPVRCEVLAADPEKLLSIQWGPVWTVSWRLEPEGEGTRLFLTHDGFDLDDPGEAMAYKIMGGGWRTGVPRALEKVLAALEA